MAINGSKRVVSPCLWQDKPAGATHDFKHLQLEQWPVGQWVLRLGWNQLVLKDPFWKIGHIPLLVDEIRVVEEVIPLPQKSAKGPLAAQGGNVGNQRSEGR